jgi:hypothetical protein
MLRNWIYRRVGVRIPRGGGATPPFNLAFLSGHHRHTHEMAIRCHEAGVQLSLPPEETQDLLRHYVTKGLIPWLGLEALGVHYHERYGDLKRAVEDGEVNAFMVSLPEHLELVKQHFGPIPVAADHMVNRYEDYRARGLRNFVSPSRRALGLMNVPNQLLSIKVRDFAWLNRTTSGRRIPVRKRRGFYSYIHNYERQSSRAFRLFTAIVERLRGEVELKNFGRGSPHGEVVDLPTMLRSRATLHIKDWNVCCNAVIDSISVGIPVLVDDETLDRLGLEDYVVHMISGIRFRDADEGEEWIRLLDRDDDLLAELSRRTKEFALLKCRNTSKDVERFRQFVERMR